MNMHQCCRTLCYESEKGPRYVKIIRENTAGMFENKKRVGIVVICFRMNH